MGDTEKRANLQTLRTTLLVVVVMFGFGYALVPLYNLVCEKLGFNGQAEQISQTKADKFKIDKSRTITVVFDSTINSNLPWEFYSKTSKIDVHPGETKRVLFYAKNLAARDITGRATFRVTPPEAARFFKKTECFCFTQQKLKKGEAKDMPVLFSIDPRISRKVKIVYLSYIFLNAEKYAKKK